MPGERRTGRGRLPRRGFLAAVAALGTASAGATAQGNGYTMPTLRFADPATRSRLGDLYTRALTALADRHTIHADPTVYDRAGLLAHPPGTFVRAGGGYPHLSGGRGTRPSTRGTARACWRRPSAATRSGRSSTAARTGSSCSRTISGGTRSCGSRPPCTTTASRATGTSSAAPSRPPSTPSPPAGPRLRRRVRPVPGPGFMNDGISGYPGARPA